MTGFLMIAVMVALLMWALDQHTDGHAGGTLPRSRALTLPTGTDSGS